MTEADPIAGWEGLQMCFQTNAPATSRIDCPQQMLDKCSGRVNSRLCMYISDKVL